MLREELYHPMMVHFPIVLFLLALAAKIVSIAFYGKPALRAKFTELCSFCLTLTPLFYLLSMYLGDMAFDQIKNQFCDLRAVTLHEESAQLALVFVIVALIFESLRHVKKIQARASVTMEVLLVASLLAGNALIIRTAHSGGELVYEKGAAVKNADPKKCLSP